MTTHSTASTETDLLEDVLRLASSLLKIVPPSSTPPPDRDVNTKIPDLRISFPHDILAPILTLPVSNKVQQDILLRLKNLFLQLRQQYISAYRDACIAVMRGPNFGDELGLLHQVYQARFQMRCLPMIQSQVSFVLAEVANYQQPVCDAKRPFNNEYTPILEKYFEYNAYPSSKHQEILAAKSDMTRRQIEVWFQNHRNRAKKEDRVLKRFNSASDYPLEVALSVLPCGNLSQVNRLPTPSSEEDSGSETPDEFDDVPKSTSCIDNFNSFRPRHVFPTLYPSKCPEPFPSENGVFIFPPPTWIRRPMNGTPKSVNSTLSDVDELARMFHLKLNLSNGVRSNLSKARKPRSSWFAATVTVPPPAPHPALVRSPFTSSVTLAAPSGTLPSQFTARVRAASIAQAFVPSEPRQQNAQKPQKISPLPLRIPTSSNTTSHPPTQSISRMSSFSSDYSSRSRSSSSSSRSRTPEPTTPHLPTWDIPAIQDADQVHQSPDDFDFGTLFGDHPDVFTATSPGSLSISQSVTLAADKRPSIPAFDFSSIMTFAVPGHIQARS